MSDCPNLSSCPFFLYCQENKKEMACNGFAQLYCKSGKQTECIRRKLSEKFGRECVPKNMMPTGSALPGSDKTGWSTEALDHMHLL